MGVDVSRIVFLAVVVEGLVTYASTLCVDGVCQWKMFVSAILGIVVAFCFRIDVFSLMGLESTVPFVPCILSGILIGRGSNYVADIIKTGEGVICKN